MRTPVYLDGQYVGVLTAVLAIGALVLYARDAPVVALGCMCLVAFVLTFFGPIDRALNALPALHAVRLPRAISFLGFGLAVLAAMGIEAFVRSPRPNVLKLFGGLFAVSGVVLALVWIVHPHAYPDPFFPLDTASYAWAAGGIVVGLVAVGLGLAEVRRGGEGGIRGGADGVRQVWRGPRLRVWAGALLLGFETIFMVAAGYSLWSSSPNGLQPTPAVRQLQRAVGSSVVGLGKAGCFLPPLLGIPVNANILFGVHEFAVYDPLTARVYYSSWGGPGPAGGPRVSHYCPGISTVALARRYGVTYVLEPAGTPGPRGSVPVETVGGEGLFRIPGVGVATVTLLDGRTETVPVDHPAPNSWRMQTTAPVEQVLRLRLTNVPGWHASIDGRPLPLEPFDGVMLQADVPAGHHDIMITYWPTRFTVGLWLAAFGVIIAVGALLWEPIRRRLRHPTA